MIGVPVSESQGLEDVGELASRPKVPKPPVGEIAESEAESVGEIENDGVEIDWDITW